MRKLSIILLTLVLALSMVACSTETNDQPSKKNTYEFKGKILSIEDQMALVQVDSGSDILTDDDQVNVFIGKTGEDQLKVEDMIIVEFDGTVMTSWPLQVHEISVRKADGTVIDIVKDDATKGEQVDENATAVGVHFEATIVEVVEDGYIVEPVKDSDELISSNRIIIFTDQDFKLGDKVSIIYDGEIMESDPAQINHRSVELVE